jgi:ABC-type phosphate transport system substrate-binding protein
MMNMTAMKRIGLILTGFVLSLPASGAGAEAVVVVSARSSVNTLSKNQIVDIFLGRMHQFPNDGPVEPVDQTEGSATRDEFYLNFSGQSPAQIKAYWSKIIFTGRGQPPREVQNGLQVKKFVAAHPNAIGYIQDKLVDDSVKVLHVK